MVARVAFLLICLLCLGCYKGPECGDRVQSIQFEIKNMEVLTPRNYLKYSRFRSSSGNLQSIINSWNLNQFRIDPPNGKIIAEKCRSYYSENVTGKASTTLYPIYCNYGIIKFPDSVENSQFWCTLYNNNTLKQWQSFSLPLTPRSDSLITYCFRFNSLDSGCYQVRYKLHASYTNLYGITAKNVMELNLPYGILRPEFTDFRKIWFSFNEGLVGIETNNSENWFIDR
jgi:hypothetical protein